MPLGAVVVSVAFGLAMGWGLVRFLPDRRPAFAALLVALVAGVGVLGLSIGSDPETVGGSLALGSVSALSSFALTNAASTQP